MPERSPEWEAERERFIDGLVAMYRDGAYEAVAKACDKVIDPSGALLGEVRRRARGA